MPPASASASAPVAKHREAGDTITTADGAGVARRSREGSAISSGRPGA